LAPSERPGRCYRAANVRIGGTLARGALAGKERGPATGLELGEAVEAAPPELHAETLGVDEDRRLAATRVAEDDEAAGREDPCQLVEEGDHVRERDELEDVGLERQRRRVGELEANALGEVLRGLALRLGDHRLRDVDADHLGVREAPRHGERAVAGAGPDIERAARRRLDLLERVLVRSEVSGVAPRVPTRRQPVELAPERPAEETPERRPADDDVGRHAREALAEGYRERLAIHRSASLTASTRP